MTREQIEAILKSSQAKLEKDNGWVLPDGSNVTFHVAHDGASLSFQKLESVKFDGELLYAKSTKQTVAIVVSDVFAVAIDGAKDWYGLGPVAVAPRDQGHGVGSALIRAGLAELAERGAAGCVVLGEPDYYGRFGFRNDGELRYADAPPQYFQSLPFGDDAPKGEVRYHPSFSDTSH